MKTVWTKGLKGTQKEEIQREFLSSAHIRNRLTEILNEKITTAQGVLRSKNSYENPAWAFQQADGIGYERALYEVISLLSNKTVDNL